MTEPQYDCSDMENFYLSGENRALRQERDILLAALLAARAALEDTASQASLCVHHTALTSWPAQKDWLVREVRREAQGGINAIDRAIAKAEGR